MLEAGEAAEALLLGGALLEGASPVKSMERGEVSRSWATPISGEPKLSCFVTLEGVEMITGPMLHSTCVSRTLAILHYPVRKKARARLTAPTAKQSAARCFFGCGY